jgi:hypothetical protein
MLTDGPEPTIARQRGACPAISQNPSPGFDSSLTARFRHFENTPYNNHDLR